MLPDRRRPSLLVKLNFLILGLALTLYGMYGVHSRGVPSPLLTALGIARPVTERLCKTRVEGVIQPDKLKLMQNGNNWLADGAGNDPAHKVNFIAVEKWLSEFCSAKLEPVAGAAVSSGAAKADIDQGFAPALFIKFIDGGIDVLRSAGDGRFMWHDRVYRSADLDKALRELDAIPDGGPRAPAGH